MKLLRIMSILLSMICMQLHPSGGQRAVKHLVPGSNQMVEYRPKQQLNAGFGFSPSQSFVAVREKIRDHKSNTGLTPLHERTITAPMQDGKATNQSKQDFLAKIAPRKKQAVAPSTSATADEKAPTQSSVPQKQPRENKHTSDLGSKASAPQLTLKEHAKQTVQKTGRKQLASIKEDRSFDLTAPIPDLKLATKSKGEKIARFTYATAVHDTQKMYHMVQDPDIAAHYFEPKTFEEYKAIADKNRKKVIIHAIDNNDVQFVSHYMQRFPQYNRGPAIKYAAERNRPRIVATLLQHNPPQSLDSALTQHMNATADEALCYQQAGELLIDDSKVLMEKKLRREREDYQTELQNVIPEGFTDQALDSTLKYILPTGNIDARLEAAIIDGEKDKAIKLVQDGFLELVSKDAGYHALKLAVQHGHSEIVKTIAARSRYLTVEERNELKRIAQKEICKAHTLDNEQAKDEIVKKYKSIIHFITIDLPLTIRAKNAQSRILLFTPHPNRSMQFLMRFKHGANPNAMITSPNGLKHPLTSWLINSQQPALVKIALKYGANANALHDGEPIASLALLYDNPQLLEMLLAHGANPNAVAKAPDGKMHPLLVHVIQRGKLAHTRLLLKHGADMNIFDANGQSILLNTLQHDPQFLEMFLINKLDPNILITDNATGKKHPLLLWAINCAKPVHARLLLKYGAKADALDGYGNPIAAQALLIDDPQLLEMLFEDPHNKANPNALKTDLKNGNKFPLLASAVTLEKPVYARILIKHGADVNALNSGGNPIIFHTLLAKDPQCLEILLENGANPNANVQNGKTGIWHPALFWTVRLNMPAHARLLIQHGADIKALHGHGQPIAWAALRSQNPEFTKMFFADPSNNEDRDESSKKITMYPYIPS